MFATTLRTFALAATLLTAPAWAEEGLTNRDLMRRLRIFGQRDKLRADRSKGRETWA